VLIGWESIDNTTSVSGVTYGDQSMTQVPSAAIGTPDTGYMAGVAFYYLLESGIAAASGTTITPSFSGTAPADTNIAAASYQYVNQTGSTTTFPEAATAESNEATPNPFTTIDITEAVDNLVCAGITCGNATSFTWQSDMTEQEDILAASSATGFADRLSTTNANVTVEATVASQNRAAAASFEVLAAAVVTYNLSGITKDNSGTALGGCECFLLKDNQNDTLTFKQHTTSHATTGVYMFSGIEDGDAQYLVYAYKDSTPHVFDVTDHVLDPVSGA
jgi:hypothetical protein